MTILYVVLFIATAIAAFFDYKSGKIPNGLTYGVIIGGVGLNYFLFGIDGLYTSVLSGFVTLIFFIVPYCFKQIGAGDVKLMIGIATLMNVYYTAGLIIVSSLIACIIIFIKKIKTHKKLKDIENIRFGYYLFLGVLVYQGVIFVL